MPKDFSAYVGATAAFNTVYASYSTQSGFSVGWSAGLSPQMGFPISSNFTSVGANYNISHNAWSGNVSAWNVDKTGWTFNPSFSAMVLEEHTTNFARGQGFRNNNQVLNHFVAKGQHQEALKYFGFKGDYVNGEGTSFSWFKKDGSSGINFRDDAFTSYDALLSTYMKEQYHLSRFAKSGFNGFELADADEFSYARHPEERLGVIHQYENQGLFYRDSYNKGLLRIIRGLETDIVNYNDYIYRTPYQFTPYQNKWWHFIYKIPRKW